MESKSQLIKCVMGCKAFTGGEIKHHKGCPYYSDSLSRTFDENSEQLERLQKKYNQIRQIWLDTDKSITKLKEAVKQYVSDKGDDYETFEADYLD